MTEAGLDAETRATTVHRSQLLAALHTALERGQPGDSRHSRPVRTSDPSYPVWRLLHAWQEAGAGSAFGPDLVVLLRQVVRWHGVPFAVSDLHDSVLAGLASSGHAAGVRMSYGHLEAVPLAPRWLTSETMPVDGIDAAPEQRRPDERIPAERYISRLGFDHWNSPAQKEGVWRALIAPPRGTVLVALPTGAGKSLCFQLAALAASGLTVVVVPTVALAIDHWHSAREVVGTEDPLYPHYYAADDPSQPADVVLQAVREGRCRLLFTSPEACVSGRLRPVLAAAAQSGRLDALVIDEAHLADSWGMYFRVDFQVLAALRRQWLLAPNARLRTLLLSATFTPECRRVLRRLFADKDEAWTELVSHRLRPEMTYFAQTFSASSVQQEAVLECAWRVPRPAILYTTTRADARAWTDRLRAQGFSRLACFDGDTPAAERRRLLEQWRADHLDVMVATSAFGMGVDKPDVRAVVHACLPEDLHRYYQEVGRGARDGASSLCLLLPLFPRDREVAEGLAPRLLKPETLARRWSALWDTHRPVPGQPNTWRLRTDARPANLYGADTGRRNIAWNKRLLLQLARADLVDLVDAGQAPTRGAQAGPPRDGAAARSELAPAASWSDESDGGVDVAGVDLEDAEYAEEATVRVHFAPHAADVDVRITRMRVSELELMRRGLEYMLEHIEGGTCIGRILRRMYGAETAVACGGCPACRRRGWCPPCPPLPVPSAVPTGALRQVIADVPSPTRDDQRRRFQMLARRLAAVGVRRFVCLPDMFPTLLRVLDDTFEASASPLYRVDVFDPAHPPASAAHEGTAVLHAGAIIGAALHLRIGTRVVHLITTDTPHLDRQRRRPLELEGAPYYPRPESWAPEI
jgi:ATP-dependent DNA helicase RecQ